MLAVDCALDDGAKPRFSGSFPGLEWGGADARAAVVPYRVRLDGGAEVLAHRDEHWLVRDLALQAEGPCQAAYGAPSVRRIEKRRRGDGWEAVDHSTRKVRRCGAPESDGSDSDRGLSLIHI